jgi:hypothetical protein
VGAPFTALRDLGRLAAGAERLVHGRRRSALQHFHDDSRGCRTDAGNTAQSAVRLAERVHGLVQSANRLSGLLVAELSLVRGLHQRRSLSNPAMVMLRSGSREERLGIDNL